MFSSAFAQTAPAGSPVAAHGQLRVLNGNIVGTHNNPVQLRGMSLFWSHSQHARHFYNAATVAHLATDWRASVVRAAMAIDPQENWGGPGEQTFLGGDRINNRQRVLDVVAAARTQGIYVIIDWHSYRAHNINSGGINGQTEAVAFFTDMAQMFNGVPNVIYEIYNEPGEKTYSNNPAQYWTTIKPYMQAVVNAIRQHDALNLIMIGTPNWCQHPDVAAADPITGTNLVYTFHFYAGGGNDHRQTLRDRVTLARTRGAAVFASEIGSVSPDGAGSHNAPETDIWMNFMDERHIGWAAWSLSAMNQGSAALSNDQGQSSTLATNPASWTLSASGSYFRDRIRAGATLPTVTSVTISPASAQVARGTTQQFTAAVAGANNPSQGVTWTVTGNQSSSTNININGLLTVAAGETASSITVRATSTANTAVSGTRAVTITASTGIFILDDLEDGDNLNNMGLAWYYVVASGNESGGTPLETATAANPRAIITNAGPADADGPMSFVPMANNSSAGNLTAAQVGPARGDYVAALRFVNLTQHVGTPGPAADPTYARHASVAMATELSSRTNVGIGTNFNTVTNISFDMWAPTGMVVIFKVQTTENAAGNDNSYKTVVVGTGSWTTYTVRLTSNLDRAPTATGAISVAGAAITGVGPIENICATGGGIAGDLCQEPWYGSHFQFRRQNVTALAWQVNTYGDYGNDTRLTASNTVIVDNIMFDNFTAPVTSILSQDRVIPGSKPGMDADNSAASAALTGEFTAGPNPVEKSSGAVSLFWQGKRIQNAALSVYDASGNVVVRKIGIKDKASDTQIRREVGAWNLKDRKGRLVGEGAYLVRGTITDVNGKKEKISLMIGVR